MGLAGQPVAGADIATCLRGACFRGPGGHGRAALATVEDALEQGGLSEPRGGFLAITPEQGLDLGKGRWVDQGRVLAGMNFVAVANLAEVSDVAQDVVIAAKSTAPSEKLPGRPGPVA
jgi:hypothetical protein